MKRRVLSMFLLLCMLLNLVCVTSFAVETDTPEDTQSTGQTQGVAPAPEEEPVLEVPAETEPASGEEETGQPEAVLPDGEMEPIPTQEKTVPAEPIEDQKAQAAWEASLGEFTMTDANAYTPTEAQNLLTAGDTGHAYDPAPAEEDEAGTAPEFVPGEVLYARQSGGLTLFGADDTDAQLAALGVSDATAVYTNEKSDVLSLMDAGKSTTTWYRASVSGDVVETVDALKDVSGIVDAEPNYIYTTEVVGVPSQTEIQNAWYLDAKHGDNGLHKGWWKRWWPGMPEDATWTDVEEMISDSEVPAPGKDVVVAVIDTGVDYTHQDLTAAMWVNGGEIAGNGVDDDNNGYIDDVYGIDATANPRFDGAIAGDPMDYNGHGTHVAGIIAMSSNGEGGVGAAYGAKIMAIKAGQATGTFTSADIAEAIVYAHAHGADVINMSFGGTGQSNLVREALEDAFTDCVLVAAAGNDGLPTTDAPDEFLKKEDIYPASYNFVIGVMATDESGNLASFSNWDYYGNANAEYELAAPGVNIYSTLPGNRYASWNGTSMAAPCVSAAAAVIRSYYNDKNEYNSRFIMGQLVSATTQTVNYVDKIGVPHTYAKLDLYDSLTNLPKPNLRMAEVFALDNVKTGAANDGDRIMDAGETIDLGVAVRNQWGQSGAIKVKADATVNGIPNPYVTFLTDEVTLDPAGTFQTVDNGFVWEDSLLTDVDNPIRFKLADDTPNDTQIQINLTVTTTNGLDTTDTATYTILPKPTFTFRVQRGAAIRGHITTDTTLTADKYWIVENALLVDEGATLTVEPGTQIQFWSSDYEDAYGERTMAYISNSGSLKMIGTESDPIEMFPGSNFEDYAVLIYGDGTETLRYCAAVNPYFGRYKTDVDCVDHCKLEQNHDRIRNRTIDASGYINDSYIASKYILQITNSIIKNVGYPYDSSGTTIFTSHNQNNLFDNSNITLKNNYDTLDIVNSVFLSIDKINRGLYPYAYKGFPSSLSISEPFTYEGSASKFVILEKYSPAGNQMRELAEAVADSASGTLLSIENQAEWDGFLSAIYDYLSSISNAYKSTIYFYAVSCILDEQSDSWIWGSGSTFLPNDFNESTTSEYNYSYIKLNYNGNNGFTGSLHATDSSNVFPFILEFPAEMPDALIKTSLRDFDLKNWNAENLSGSIYNSAILNPVLNKNPDRWTHFTAPSYTNEYYYPLHGNYWGTENSTLINKMIIDDDDYPGTRADIVETPILTLNDDLSSIYPFVTKIWLTEPGGSTLVEDAAPGVTYDVHVTFNRDMDQTVQPSITYGGEAPFTDYGVTGDWKTAREWVGQTKISSVSAGGNMIFQAKGGRADDDHWLVCGTDNQRFQFNINAATAQSMVLNAVGGAGKVNLSWAQNDYELLAGYNLYRSTKADSGFTKLNTAVLNENSYTDTDVAPGVTYYYYFTVVDTDGEEITGTQSNIASAAPLDNINPTVIHTPVASAKQGRALSVSCQATDNIAVSSVTLYYRAGTAGDYQSVTMTYSDATQRYTGSIPAASVTGEGVQYYIEACDGAGNRGTSGSYAVPYSVSVDGSVTLLTVSPNVVNIGSAPESMTVYGTNFAEGMTVKVGATTISEYAVNSDGTELTFATPNLSIGSYPVTVTRDGKTATLTSAVTYRDTSSYVQLNPGEGVPGVEMRLPLYAVQSGPLYALRTEIEVPASAFTSVTAQAATGFGGQVQASWRNGVLTISMVNARGYTTSAAEPVAWVVLTPKPVAGQTTAVLTMKTAKINDVSVLSSPQTATAVITPNYKLTAHVTHYKGGIAISGVQISAANITGKTDANGSTLLQGIASQTVSVTATKADDENEAVTLLDVLLMLQYLVGEQTLDEFQLLAADVDNNGSVTEMDAVGILQKLVELKDSYEAGVWRFVPATKTITLTDGENTVDFMAILVGDVDGSWKAAS